MKKIHFLFVALLVSVTLFSCSKKDEMLGAIYSPNNDLVSQSEEDLTATIGEVLHADDVEINSIKFLDVEEGFIAELDVAVPNASNRKVFYISGNLADKLVYDDSVEVVENNTSGQRGTDVSVTCSCSISSPASQGCVAGLEVGSDVITASCTDYDCTSSCLMTVQISLAP